MQRLKLPGDVVRRHESLRTIFTELGGTPYQRILEPASAEPGLEVVPATEGTLARGLSEAARYCFDLSTEIPLRASLFTLEHDQQVLLLLVHHIAADGWSMVPLVRDLTKAYMARLKGCRAQLPVLPVQYADYTLWQEQTLGDESDPESSLGRQLAYWRQTLEALPEQLDLPTDQPRPAIASYRGRRVPFNLSAELHGRLLTLAHENQSSLFMVLQAGIAVLLTRLGAGTDIPIGSPVAGRTDIGLEELVGFFVNTLVLRTDTWPIPASASFWRVCATRICSLCSSGLPFERLVELLNPVRSLSRHPLFQVMLAFQNTPETSLELPGIIAALEPVVINTAKFDLLFNLNERRAGEGGPDGIEGLIEYRTDLFEPSTVEAIGRRLVALLEAVVADPSQPIGRIDLLAPEERRQILFEWNATACDLPQATLPVLFEAQVERSPEAIALVFEESTLSYAELNARANRLANVLIGRGVGPENLVAIALPRSAEMIIALLGILKAGAAYLPLDPEYPAERLAYMLRDARPACVLTTAQIAQRLPESVAQLVLDHPYTAGALARGPETNPSDAERTQPLTPHKAAYVIFTSGSTGAPKGVAVPHCAITRLVLNTNYVELGPPDRIAHLSNVCFDAATFEIWGALLTGACVVLVPKAVALDPDRFAAELERRKVSTLCVTTAFFNELAAANGRIFQSVKQVLFGGEAVNPESVRRVLESGGPPRRLLHVYGPTECTTFATFHPVTYVEKDAATIPIGAPDLQHHRLRARQTRQPPADRSPRRTLSGKVPAWRMAISTRPS